jgi:hypothetical protein
VFDESALPEALEDVQEIRGMPSPVSSTTRRTAGGARSTRTVTQAPAA